MQQQGLSDLLLTVLFLKWKTTVRNVGRLETGAATNIIRYNITES